VVEEEVDVVSGDFNARSAAWGDWETNARGDELAIFADALGLVIVNEGSNPTFTGIGSGSIVDVQRESGHIYLPLDRREWQ